jgi:hypothetical protein
LERKVEILKMKTPAFAGVFVGFEVYQWYAPERAIPRTWDRLLDILTKLNVAGQLPDLSGIFRRDQNSILEDGERRRSGFAAFDKN